LDTTACSQLAQIISLTILGTFVRSLQLHFETLLPPYKFISVKVLALQALQRGFNHRSLGRLDHLEVQYKHSVYCHVRCQMIPSMKPGLYHVYLHTHTRTTRLCGARSGSSQLVNAEHCGASLSESHVQSVQVHTM